MSVEEVNYWDQDLLNYSSVGHAFTSLIKTIDTGKVISIEAGFGRGKTFFRKAWAKQLLASGEVVIEIDAQQSDHSGDPIVTLLGALVEAVPDKRTQRAKKAIQSAKKLGVMSAKAITRVALRTGAEEVINALTDTALDKIDDFEALEKIVSDFGDGMSKAAGQFIAAQMAAEKVRREELPKQISNLHAALVGGNKSGRVIVIIDELDRCHPEYAIAILEALKLVFNQEGFVFCLMVNATYLEKLAHHRFGAADNDERYLDKFVDLRLKLQPEEAYFKKAVFAFASELPLEIPYGDTEHFSVKTAAKLAAQLAVVSELSLRKVQRILLKVEIALRCYKDFPLDAPLLVFMAFYDEVGKKIEPRFLRRSSLTPEYASQLLEKNKSSSRESIAGRDYNHQTDQLVVELAPELAKLPRDRYRFPDSSEYYDWAKVLTFLAPHYIPSHRRVLDAVASLTVD